MDTLTKEQLIVKLEEIRKRGWIKSRRKGNHGSVGNTLEDLLEIPENNLPIPNAAEWELKCQRISNNSRTNSLTTLFHLEPSPRACKFVPAILLPHYGWNHQKAGITYPEDEKSFRQTIGTTPSDRGFCIVVDRIEQKILVSFNSKLVSAKHDFWLKTVEHRIGLGELNPQPYWGFQDLYHKAGTKLHNCFLVSAQVKKEDGEEYFFYEKILMLSGFSLDKLTSAIENSNILIDFDARTGHNHGTKFRYRQNRLHEMYDNILEI